MKKLAVRLAVLASVAVTSLALAGVTITPELRAALDTPGSIERGKIAYETCRGCHKPDAAGRPDAGYPQLAGQHTQVLIKQMLDTRSGKRSNPKMHPFIEDENIKAEDIPHLAAYLNSLPIPDTNRKGSGILIEVGKFLYEKDCADCHGPQGEGDPRKFNPRIRGQHYPYLYRETLDIRDGYRHNANAEMVKTLKTYSDNEIEAVGDYMSRMKP